MCRSYLMGIGGNCLFNRGPDIGETFCKFGNDILMANDVIADQNLSIAIGEAPIPNVGIESKWVMSRPKNSTASITIAEPRIGRSFGIVYDVLR